MSDSTQAASSSVLPNAEPHMSEQGWGDDEKEMYSAPPDGSRPSDTSDATAASSEGTSNIVASAASESSATIEYDKFEQMGLSRNLLRGIYSCGFNHPSPIQRKGIVPIVSGGNVIAQANSGSGKTAMFSIGTLHNIDPRLNACQAILLSPTRDLAIQTSFVIRSIATFMPEIRIGDMIGGVTSSNDSDRFAVKRNPPHVVVGTPGRVLHMITSRTLSVSNVCTLVLDEADEMLTQGFRQQLVEIFQTLNENIQIVFCSATMPPEAVEISTRLMQTCTKILIPPEEVTLKGISQFYVEVAEKFKLDTLLDLYSMIPITQSVVFCNTKRRVDLVAQAMRERGHSVAVMSSDMSISDRMSAMQEFRAGSCRILISSNLIARGIDVQQVSLVINYDLPREYESYIHRIGRSGRYGRKGVAINLVSPGDSEMLANIVTHYSAEIVELPENVASVFDAN